MRDHYFINEDGIRTSVADLPIEIINDILTNGCVEMVLDEPGETLEHVMERLRIELIVRDLTC